MNNFGRKVHRVHMELGGKLLNSLRIKTKFLERLQSGSVVDGAAHTQKDEVESNGGSLENVAEIFVLFLCGVQPVLRSGVLTKLDLDEVDVTPSFAEVFRSVLSGVGGSTGGWRCCWGAPSLPQLPPATSKNPPSYIKLLEPSDRRSVVPYWSCLHMSRVTLVSSAEWCYLDLQELYTVVCSVNHVSS